jgi:hypothetical protein
MSDTECNIQKDDCQVIDKNQLEISNNLPHRFEKGNTLWQTRQKKQKESAIRYRDSMMAAFHKSGGFARVVEICNKSQKAFILLFKEINKYLLPRSVEIDISKSESKLVLVTSGDKLTTETPMLLDSTQPIDTTIVTNDNNTTNNIT